MPYFLISIFPGECGVFYNLLSVLGRYAHHPDRNIKPFRAQRLHPYHLAYRRDRIWAELIRKIDLNEYKRKQAPPGLRVTTKAFGIGRRIPIAQRYVEK